MVWSPQLSPIQQSNLPQWGRWNIVWASQFHTITGVPGLWKINATDGLPPPGLGDVEPEPLVGQQDPVVGVGGSCPPDTHDVPLVSVRIVDLHDQPIRGRGWIFCLHQPLRPPFGRRQRKPLDVVLFNNLPITRECQPKRNLLGKLTGGGGQQPECRRLRASSRLWARG